VTSSAELRTAALETLSALPELDGDAGADMWSRGGTPFAVLSGSTIEIRLGSTIGAAAVRTPDTHPSDRGPDWIAFSPAELDDHALDRLEAWLEAAHRRAIG
jgi:hypothetical protein